LEDIGDIGFDDFMEALGMVRPSVNMD